MSPAQARQEAATHYQRGISLYKESNYSAALSEFKAAQAAMPGWEVLFNLGLCQRRLFQYGAAIASFERYLGEGGAKVSKDRRAAVADELQQIRSLTAPIAVVVKGPSAKVLVDGEPVGNTPLAELVLLGPGKHLVRAERDGYSADQKTIEVVSGEAQAVELAPISLTAPGHVTLECTPAGAMLTIDDAAPARCPLQLDLAPGTHEVLASADGYAAQRTEVIVQPAQPRSVRLTLVPMAAPEPPKRPFPMASVGLLGGGVVVGGLGAMFAALANGAGNELTALSKMNGTFDAQAMAIQSTGQRNNVLGWVFIGAGSAIAATGLVTLVINLSQQPVQVSFAPTASGVSACGSF